MDFLSRHKCLALAVFMLPVVAVFAFGVTGGHIGLDDWGYTSGCPFVKGGLTWANVCRAFTDLGYGAIWMPVTFMSYMADVSLFGDDWRAYHAVGVVLHLCNFVLVALFVEKALRLMAVRSSDAAWLAALSAALIWALHPMRAEGVVFVAARKEELWTMFSLAGLLAYAGFLEDGRIGRYAVAFALFLLACMSKPTAVAFPLLAASLHLLPNVGDRWRRLLWLLPMFVVAVGVGLLTLHSQSHPTNAEHVGLYDAALWWRILNAAVALGLYLYYTIVPAGIHIDYMAVFNGWPQDGWLGLAVLSFALVAAAIAFAKSDARGRAAILFAAALFAFSVGPTLGVLGYVNGDQSMADRYVYFPHVALAFLVAYFVARAVESGKCVRVAFAAVCVTVLLECVFAVPVVKSYENGFTAYSRALAKDPGNWRALRVVGNEYCARMGRSAEGIAMLRKSLAIRKSKLTADSLAYVLALKGEPSDFAEVKRLCVEAERSPEIDKGGMMLDALGVVRMREGDYKSAARLFSAALNAKERNHSPDYSMLWLGASLANIGAEREAASMFIRARASRVQHVRNRSEEALTLMKGGRKKVFDWTWAEGVSSN